MYYCIWGGDQKSKWIMDHLDAQPTLSQANVNFCLFLSGDFGVKLSLFSSLCLRALFFTKTQSMGGLLGFSMLATFLVRLFLLSSNQQKSILLKLWLYLFFCTAYF